MDTKRSTPVDVTAALDKVDWVEQDALTDDDIARQIAENPEAASDVVEGLQSGRLKPLTVNIKAIRARLGMSQERFAETFGLSIGTLRNWEQHRCEPDEAGRVLLQIIDREPEAAMRAMRSKAA